MGIILLIKGNFYWQYIWLSIFRNCHSNCIIVNFFSFNIDSIIWITKADIKIFAFCIRALEIFAKYIYCLIIRTLYWTIRRSYWYDLRCTIVLVAISRVLRNYFIPVLFVIWYFHNSFCVKNSRRCFPRKLFVRYIISLWWVCKR